MNLPVQPTHYQVLGISPSLFDSQADPSLLLKQAYRRALLRHHPDKSRPRPHHFSPTATTTTTTTTSTTTTTTTTPCSSTAPRSHTTRPPHVQSHAAKRDQNFTIDQISSALAVLSSPRRRADYNASLLLSRAATALGGDKDPAFQTGIESVDLDDLELDEGREDGVLEGARWHRACRCGNERGYAFSEEDLTDVEHEGSLMVGCQDCSLWLQVHFAMLEDDEDRVGGQDGGSDPENGTRRSKAQAMSNGKRSP